jgi:hypothetical protein
MRSRTKSLLPARLEGARRRFEAWRESCNGRARIPELLWTSAVKLAGAYGIHRTARTLRLDYLNLKKRVEVSAKQAPTEGSTPSFVELISPGTASLPECTVEFEDPRGRKLRIHLKGAGAPDLTALTRAFWNAEA